MLADNTPKKDYSNVVFATKKDTTCGMPLNAGIGDTLQWNRKVYGFCSKQCKDAFVEKLKKEINYKQAGSIFLSLIKQLLQATIYLLLMF